MKRIWNFFIIFFVSMVLLSACKHEEKSEEEMDLMGSIIGNWEGTIQIPNSLLPINIKFGEDISSISIPVQGLNDYPLTNIKLKDSALSFEMALQGQRITFDGILKADNILGTFTQSGQSFQFELNRAIKDTATEEEEIIRVKVSGGEIKGVLERPEGEGPYPVMIIIAGSGPTDRNGNSILLPGKNNSLKMLAEDLAKQGIASIRYDKRGLGQNASLATKEELLTFDHFINDAVAFITYANNDKQFSKTGVIGHSEGSLIGMVASSKENVDVFVSIAGAGRPINEVLIEQLEEQLSSNLLEESKVILSKLMNKQQVTNISSELQSIFRPSVQPYLISWIAYNPAEVIQHLTSKVLIINGTNDIQVPVSDAQLLQEAKGDSSLLIIENMNHVLKESPEDVEGNIATYSNASLPLAKGLVEGIVEYLQ